MRIGRTLPPAATPIYLQDIVWGIKGFFSEQEEINRFSRELQNFFQVKNCFLISSGKAALTLILRALHRMSPDRNEVIIPAFTCYSVPAAIVCAGLKIRLCDVNPDSLNFDFNQLKQILANPEKILAVLPTHLFGLTADMKSIRRLFERVPEIKIVEDSAQAMGVRDQGSLVGTLGDIGFFSLGRGKAISTVEGGVIVTNQDDIANAVRQQFTELETYSKIEQIKLFVYSIILLFFMSPLLYWIPRSLPFLKLGETRYEPVFSIKKMSGFQAGLSHGWQQKLKRFTKIRSEHSSFWADLISTHSDYCLLETVKNFSNTKNTTIRFPVRIKNISHKKRILNISQRQGLGLMPTYPEPINRIMELIAMFNGQEFPGAREIVETLITLPVHPFLSGQDRLKIKRFLQKQ